MPSAPCYTSHIKSTAGLSSNCPHSLTNALDWRPFLIVDLRSPLTLIIYIFANGTLFECGISKLQFAISCWMRAVTTLGRVICLESIMNTWVKHHTVHHGNFHRVPTEPKKDFWSIRSLGRTWNAGEVRWGLITSHHYECHPFYVSFNCFVLTPRFNAATYAW